MFRKRNRCIPTKISLTLLSRVNPTRYYLLKTDINSAIISIIIDSYCIVYMYRHTSSVLVCG
jgi:hypothetical protein